MAMAVHPRFPAEGFAFLQGENARDLPDPMYPDEGDMTPLRRVNTTAGPTATT